MAEPPADLPQSGNESRRCEKSSLLYSDAMYNVRDFISQEDNESLDKSYGDGSSNEICPFKLDQGEIDEHANDYRAETCVSSSRESSIQKESCKETVKSDGTLSRNEDESRCKSNRKRKTHRRMPEGIIVDFSNDVYAISRGGIKISVISRHNLVSEVKFVAAPKYGIFFFFFFFKQRWVVKDFVKSLKTLYTSNFFSGNMRDIQCGIPIRETK